MKQPKDASLMKTNKRRITDENKQKVHH